MNSDELKKWAVVIGPVVAIILALFMFSRTQRGSEDIQATMLGTPEEQACRRGEATACLTYGLTARYGRAESRNLEKAYASFATACEKGLAEGCVEQGLALSKAEGTERDVKRAAALFDQACKTNVPRACRLLGEAVRDGRGVKFEEELARGLFDKACAGGDHEACVDVGRDLMKKKTDAARAVEMFRGACSQQVAKGCFELALAYRDGRGVAASVAKAGEALHKACDGSEAVACTELGKAYVTGAGVVQSREKAAQYFGQSCKGEDAEGCFLLAKELDAGTNGGALAKSLGTSAELREKACKGGISAACANK